MTRLEPPSRVKARPGAHLPDHATRAATPVRRQVELAIHQRLGSVNRMLRPLDGFAAVCDEAHAILCTLQLDRLADRLPVALAYGEQRLVEIALALALQPKVLLLDEPMAGVPMGERRIILDALAALPPNSPS